MSKNFILALLVSVNCVAPSSAQEKLDQRTLDVFYDGLQLSRKSNQVFNAYLLETFATEYAGKSNYEIEEELEDVKENHKNQIIVFEFLYYYFNVDRESLLNDFLTNSFKLGSNNVSLISKYIANRNYLSDSEKKHQDTEARDDREKKNREQNIANNVYELTNDELEDFILTLGARLRDYFTTELIPDKLYSETEQYFFYGTYNVYAGIGEKGSYGAHARSSFLIFEELNNVRLPMMSSYATSHKVAPINAKISDKRFYTIENISGFGANYMEEIPEHSVETQNVAYYTIFKNRTLLFAKGITKIKVKNGEVSYVDNEPLNALTQRLIEKEVINLNLSNGKHRINYFFQNALDKHISNQIEVI